MAIMDWEDFHHDHHRPHVWIVSMEAKKPAHALAKADFDHLVVSLGAIGNYAIKTQGTTTHIAFEHDADADRLAAVLRPKQTTRESEWASRSLATINDATRRKTSAILRRASVPVQAKINSALTVDAVVFLIIRREIQTRAARRGAPDPNEARSFETDQQPSRSHRVPLLSGPKGWHILSIQFPRHCVVAHESCRPDFSNDGCQGPSAQVSGDHMGQGARRSTPARHSSGEPPIAVCGRKISHLRTRQ